MDDEDISQEEENLKPSISSTMVGAEARGSESQGNRITATNNLIVNPSLEYGLETHHLEDGELCSKSRRSSAQEVILSIGYGIQRVPDLVVSQAIKMGKSMNTPHAIDPFTPRSLMWCIASIVLGIANYVSDILVARALATERESDWWFILTVIFVTVPLIIVNIFSIFWFHQDHIKFRKYAKNLITERPKGGIFLPLTHAFTERERKTIMVSHFFGLGPILRHLYVIHCGRKERKMAKALSRDHYDGIKTIDDVYNRVQGPYCPKPRTFSPDEHGLGQSGGKNEKTAAFFYSLRKYYERDSAYLGLIAAFIQDGPQLILQLYILAIRNQESDKSATNVTYVALYQCASVLMSLVSLSWSIVSYEQANRWATPEKPKMSPAGCIFQFLWRFLMVASRVGTMALFVTVFRVEFFVFIGLHWLLMTIWILFMETNFCGSAENIKRPISEVVYNIVMGLVYTFDIVHMKDGPTRYKHLAYYVIVLLEDASLLAVWYIKSGGNHADDENGHHDWTHDTLVRTILMATIPGCYICGLLCLITYYRCFHPEGQMPDKCQEASLF